MRLSCFLTALAINTTAFAFAARADIVEVVHQGVACTSADALATLTLPDGSSRSSALGTPSRYAIIASQGGCVPLSLGVRMETTAIKHRTDVVSWDPDGQGVRSFWIPKIDVQTSGAPSSATLAAPPSSSPLAPAETASPGNLSVTGLTPGMSVADVKSRLGTAYVAEDVPSSDVHLHSLHALKNDKSEAYVAAFANDKLWYVRHEVEFSPGNEPNFDTLLSQLSAKYGPPTFPYVYEGPAIGPGLLTDRVYWVFDSHQIPEKKIHDSSHPAISQAECRNNSMYAGVPVPNESEGSLDIPTQFSSACSAEVGAYLAHDPDNTRLIKYLGVVMSDSQSMYRYLMEQKRVQELQDQKNAESAKSVKAPL